MGRPFSIEVNKFAQALSSYFWVQNKMMFQTEQQLFKTFSEVSKINRTPIWNHIAYLLGKSKQQVKNFYFNTWSEQFQMRTNNSVSTLSSHDVQYYKYISVQQQIDQLKKFNDFKVSCDSFKDETDVFANTTFLM
ncbi:Conserved_hypothetical protein [Hexamita inflata]|uniref:Uncharacterized protein n=1 Tax=Hexamita inflata TaxID=28002 RepID=A0AA86UDX1_9EUKA|nr:Conserved hypothetical protein [Hexamita inflata]